MTMLGLVPGLLLQYDMNSLPLKQLYQNLMVEHVSSSDPLQVLERYLSIVQSHNFELLHTMQTNDTADLASHCCAETFFQHENLRCHQSDDTSFPVSARKEYYHNRNRLLPLRPSVASSVSL
jgi:hypothetical protein